MKAHFSRFAVLGAALCIAVLPRPAAAQNLFGVTYINDELISIDPATGVGTQIGQLPLTLKPVGIGESGGSLYTFDAVSNSLVTIDPATGTASAPISLGISGVGEGGFALSSSGTGYIYSPLDAGFNPTNALYSVNVTTKTATSVGTTGVPLSSLALSNGGTLYGFGKLDGNLYTVSTTTGTASLVGNIGGGFGGSPVSALAFGSNGTLYASVDDQLFTLDTATGSGTLINPDPNALGFSSVSGLAFVPAAVPEPGTVSLFAGVFVCGAVLRRRRK